MVLYILCIKGDLDGVSSLALANDANICISIKNPLSDFEIREKVVFNPSVHVEQMEESNNNTREPLCHFTIKWEGSKKRSTIEVLDEAAIKSALKKIKKGKRGNEAEPPRKMTADDSGSWVPVLALECRGIKPYEFHPMGSEFVVISEGGVKFESDIDLEEGDWAEYDEENDISVSVSDFESKFITI